MRRIDVVPAWSFRDEQGNNLDPKLFRLLGAVHEHGKLTQASKSVGISYRHAWNLLNTWNAFFGCDLVTLQKGKGAELTPLGEKLLWAEQRVIARLEPQLKNLASELNIEIQNSLQNTRPVLKLHASHGYAVALLSEVETNFQLDLQYRSAEEALASLNRGQCDLAGFHVPAGGLAPPMLERYRHHLKPRVHRVIRFVTRRQGLMVRLDNPKSIKGIKDLVREDVRFINRQPTSGTRALLDEIIRREGIAAGDIRGFEDEEYTHSAVAAYVAAGMADVGFGVEAAARQFGLDFIPQASEDYLFICHVNTLKQEVMRRFIRTLAELDFQKQVAELPGYAPNNPGEVVAIEDAFPSD